METDDTPGARLRKARKDRNLTMADLARIMSLSLQAVHSHEMGRREISPKYAASYAEALDVAPQWIVFGTRDDRDRETAQGVNLTSLPDGRAHLRFDLILPFDVAMKIANLISAKTVAKELAWPRPAGIMKVVVDHSSAPKGAPMTDHVETANQLLGALLYHGVEAIAKLPRTLDSGFFLDPVQGLIYREIMLSANDSGAWPEPTVIGKRLEANPGFAEMGGMDYLAALIDSAPDTDQVLSLAERLMKAIGDGDDRT